MGLFGNKKNSDSAVLMATLITLGQSIDAVEMANNEELNEGWDIFVNTLGSLVDAGFIEEGDSYSVIGLGKFPDNHNLTFDLIEIRKQEQLVQAFVSKNKGILEIVYSPRNIDAKADWNPGKFADYLSRLTIELFPKFGSTKKDQLFLAAIGVYMATLISDTQGAPPTNKTVRRLIGYEFALRWLAQWNVGCASSH